MTTGSARRLTAVVCAVLLALTASSCEVQRGPGDRAGDRAGDGASDRPADPGRDRGGRQQPRDRGADERRRDASAPSPGRRVDVPFVRAVRMLERAPERGAGYDRDLFVH